MTVCFCTNSVPHLFAFFLAKGWETTNHKVRNHAVRDLVPKNGKLRAITYIADFQYKDRDGLTYTLDAKGFKTPVYRLKKKLAFHLLGLTIEEV